MLTCEISHCRVYVAKSLNYRNFQFDAVPDSAATAQTIYLSRNEAIRIQGERNIYI
jgi:hypothetical protein